MNDTPEGQDRLLVGTATKVNFMLMMPMINLINDARYEKKLSDKEIASTLRFYANDIDPPKNSIFSLFKFLKTS